MDADDIAELREWIDSLDEIERLALAEYLLTGSTGLILAIRSTSPRLQRYDYLAFTNEGVYPLF